MTHPADFTVSGDVTLADSVAIAPDVVLCANPDSQILMGTGVTIGTGSILHAYEGVLDIQEGVTIGSGVLILGHGEIGVNACVGTGTTIIDPNLTAEQMVPSHSLLGDNSRQIEQQIEENVPLQASGEVDLDVAETEIQTGIQQDNPEENASPELPPEPDSVWEQPQPNAEPDAENASPAELPPEPDSVWEQPQPDAKPDAENASPAELPPEPDSVWEALQPDAKPDAEPVEKVTSETELSQFPQPQVYGQAQLDQLLNKLLPHRKSYNNSRPTTKEPPKIGDEST